VYFVLKKLSAALNYKCNKMRHYRDLLRGLATLLRSLAVLSQSLLAFLWSFVVVCGV